MLTLTKTEVELLTYLVKNGPKTFEGLSNIFSVDDQTIKESLESLYHNGLLIRKDDSSPSLYEVNKENVDIDDSNSFKVEQNSSRQNNASSETKKPVSQDPAFVIGAKKLSLVHHGQDVTPCFEVEDLANAFVSVIDSVSSPKSDNISMLGIFGSWGRGKTYFFNIVKKYLLLREKSGIRYDIVEFNAWKYQSVPAIWASLFETIYHHKSRLFRFWFSIKRNFLPFVRDMFICFSVPFLVWLLSFLIAPLKTWAQANNIVLWSSLVSLLAYTISLISKHQTDILAIIRKYIKGISFAEHLGIQAEIEKTLADYLKTWINRNKTETRKVLLYVEDVDRCERSKMIDIIESLRTILEQPEIRKRLIVVVSLDAEVLWDALKSRFKDISDDTKLHEIIVNHFDKLFTASLSLPQLTTNDELSFLNAISRQFANERIPSQTFKPNIPPLTHKTHSKKNGFLRFLTSISPRITFDSVVPSFEINYRFPSEEDEEETVTSNSSYSHVYQLLSQSLIKYKDLRLTPRQLSCIYYRTLLAINLVSILNRNSDIDSSLTEQIIIRSYLYRNETDTQETPFENELRIVIPYPYILAKF